MAEIKSTGEQVNLQKAPSQTQPSPGSSGAFVSTGETVALGTAPVQFQPSKSSSGQFVSTGEEVPLSKAETPVFNKVPVAHKMTS